MVKPLVSEIILFADILHISTDETTNRTATTFRNNIKQSKIAVGGGMSQLADALRHKKGGFGPISGGHFGNYEVTHSFRSHSVVLRSTQLLNRYGYQKISLGVKCGRRAQLTALPS